MLRILKFITPVTCRDPDYDGQLPIPKEGELFRCRDLGAPYTFRLDKDTWTRSSKAMNRLVNDYLASPISQIPSI